MEDDVAALHRLIAHSIVELSAAAVPPLVAFVYLFALDWRMALAVLLPVFAGLAAYQRAMAGAETKYPEFMDWLARLNGAAVEFVNGIGVVKAFGTPGAASRRFQEVSRNFAHFFLDWAEIHERRKRHRRDTAVAAEHSPRRRNDRRDPHRQRGSFARGLHRILGVRHRHNFRMDDGADVGAPVGHRAEGVPRHP